MHTVLGSRRTFFTTAALVPCLAAGARAQQGGAVPAFAYDAQTRGPVPIPPSERQLQTVVAEPWLKVSDAEQCSRGRPSTEAVTCSFVM
jgi:lactonase